MGDFGFYFGIGWEHIINKEALDHIFFIAALAAIYLLRDWKQVLVLVTAFTAGHTITLILSTKQLIEVNSSWVEFLIPCTIVLTAISNLFQKNFTQRAIRINYFLALFFGMIHGLAFANVLRMILAEDQSFALSMFGFSVGLELGQILVVILILMLGQLLVSYFRVNRRDWVIFVSAIVMGLAMEMAIARFPGFHTKAGHVSRKGAEEHKGAEGFSQTCLRAFGRQGRGDRKGAMLTARKVLRNLPFCHMLPKAMPAICWQAQREFPARSGRILESDQISERPLCALCGFLSAARQALRSPIWGALR